MSSGGALTRWLGGGGGAVVGGGGGPIVAYIPFSLLLYEGVGDVELPVRFFVLNRNVLESEPCWNKNNFVIQ